MSEINLYGKIDLTNARVFKEAGRNTSARWYVLPDCRVFHSRCTGHLITSIHEAWYIDVTETLEEIAVQS